MEAQRIRGNANVSLHFTTSLLAFVFTFAPLVHFGSLWWLLARDRNFLPKFEIIQPPTEKFIADDELELEDAVFKFLRPSFCMRCTKRHESSSANK